MEISFPDPKIPQYPALVVITVDTAGNYAVADYYIVEYDEEGAIERPTE